MSFFRIDRTSNFSESDTKAYFNIQKKRIQYETPYVVYDLEKGIEKNNVFKGKQFINYISWSFPDRIIQDKVIYTLSSSTAYYWMRICFNISYSESKENINDIVSNEGGQSTLHLIFKSKYNTADPEQIVEIVLSPNIINKKMCVDLYLGQIVPPLFITTTRMPVINMELQYATYTEHQNIKNINFQTTYVAFYKNKPGTPI